MTRARPVILIAAALLAGCSSPYAKMEQGDLRWYAQDRYQFADEMPATTKDEGFDKVHRYWEAIEAVRHVDKDASLAIDGQLMTPGEARGHIRRRIRETEQQAGITWADYCAGDCLWSASIPYKIIITPIEATVMGLESPCSNYEH